MVRVLILGASIVGAYLLKESSSSNKKAKRDYDDTYNKVQKSLEQKARYAQKKDALDKLFKMKRAKQKVGDAIYAKLGETQRAFKEINNNIKESKKLLSERFTQKKLSDSRDEKRALQNEINIVLTSRKELFSTKKILQQNIRELKERLKVANHETRMVQDEINKL